MERINMLKDYCEFKLNVLNSLLDDMGHSMESDMKLRIYTKINIVKALLDFKNYAYFLNNEELQNYIEDSADIICGFYED
jgi:hypothetical protein